MPETASQSSPKNFYLRVLPESERKDLKAAAGVDGIDDEIVLLRVKIKAMLEHEPHNLDEILQTTAMLGKLIKLRYNLSGGHKNDAGAAFEIIKQEYLLPLGISTLPPNPDNAPLHPPLLTGRD
jgi:hypothetical protein